MHANHLPPTLDYATAVALYRSTPLPPNKTPKTKDGILLTLIIILIVIAAWLFFTSLFDYRFNPTQSSKSKAPAPTPAASTTASPIIPTAPPLQTAMDQRHVETENKTDISSSVPGSKNEAPAILPEHSKPAITHRVRMPSNSSRPAIARVPQTDNAAITAAKPRLPLRTLEPTPPITPQNNSGTTSVISSATNPPINSESGVSLTSSASRRELQPAIMAYPETASEPESAPVDFASISASAPPKPILKKPAQVLLSGLVVIVNKANTNLVDPADISNIYRDRVTRWPSGARILALNLPLDSNERRQFTTSILNMSPLDAATEAANRTITNRAQNEYRTKSADVVVSYIERHENAIGYVPADAISASSKVRVVYSIP
ncbi:MAG: hypothetical protein HY273_00870 [Gammaproteobacteria bacterium]|nr:hypothetical protein [Gammaproteobacteria bacterium]